jgi:hypothetical protein
LIVGDKEEPESRPGIAKLLGLTIHLTNATTMYREMDMRLWLEQAEAEIRTLRTS